MSAPAGALRREIGALGIAAVTANIVMGSGLFVIPASMAALGGFAPAAIVLCALVMGSVALCFSEASSRVPTAGGAYGFVRVAFGPVAGTVVGGLIWLSGTLAASGILAAAIDQLAPFAPAVGRGPWRALLILVVCGIFAWNAMRGAQKSTRAIEITMAIKLAPLALFVGLMSMLPAAPPAVAVPFDLGRTAPLLILGVYLFAGLESGIVMNGEIRNPTRTLPAGLFTALAGFAIVAVAIQLAAEHGLGGGLAVSKAPLVDAAARVGSWFPPVMAAAGIASMLGCAGGLAITSPRLIFAFAQDRLLPERLARLHPARRTPGLAIGVHAVVVAVLATSGEFAPLAIAASLASMAVYVVGSAAAVILRRRGVAQAGPVVAWPFTPIAAGIAIAANLAIISSAEPPELGALAAALVVFTAWALLRRRAGRADAS